MTAPMQVKLLKWTLRASGNVIGYADVEVGGLQILGVQIAKAGMVWVSFPSRECIATDGTKKYQPIVKWGTRSQSDRFSAAVIAAIRAEYPDALG